MSFLKRIFAKKEEEDYETVLSNLANDIQKRQLHLSEIRLRERRSTLLATLYTLAAWGAWISIWYLNAIPLDFTANPSVDRTIKGIPVFVGPIIILFIRRVVQIWYKNKGDAEEKSLKELMKKRRDKVEDIKKKTNYYSTRDLIQKYDEGDPASPMRPRFPVGPKMPPITPQRPPVPNPNLLNTNGPTPGTPASAALQAALSPTTPNFPVAPPRKQWYDKLADAILGDDEGNIGSPSSRYALICEKCFTHNGLVKESMWEDAQYICMKCQHFNVSARAKRQRPRTSVSPSPSSSPASANLAPQTGGGATRRSPSSPSGPSVRDLPTVDGDVEDSMMEIDPASPSPKGH